MNRSREIAPRCLLALLCLFVGAAPSRAGEDAAGRIRELLAADRWVEALDEARARHAEQPESAELATVLAEALFRAGEFESVEPLLEGLVEADNAPARALVTLGRLRAAQARRGEAGTLAERAVAAAPDDRGVLFWAADLVPTRPASIELLERYLATAEGDDPDRIEAARGTLRVLRELGERNVWEPVERPERVEVPLAVARSEDARVLGHMVRPRFGDKRKAARVLLDTGSSGLFLVERVARKRGFEPLTEETVFGGGGSQRHVSPRGLFSSFELGGVRFSNAMATTSKEELVRGGRFQGVLGVSIFDGYRVTLDLPRKKLLLDFDEQDPEAGSPYWVVSGQILVRVQTGEEQGGLFLFDTGATVSLLSAGFAESLPGVRLRDSKDVFGFGGARQGTRLADGAQLSFQGQSPGPGPFPAIDLSLRSRLTGVEISGFLGLDLLGSRRITIDTRSRRIRIDRPE